MSRQWIETYPSLEKIPGLTHGLICRNPRIDVKTDRETAIARLQEHFEKCLSVMGIPRAHLATGAQVHADSVQVCGLDGPQGTEFPDTDGLVTACPGQYLGVYVADCGAVYIVDPVQRVCALVHSGRKGSELGIAKRAIGIMARQFGSRPGHLIVQLAPCIRPPDYEIDFARQIRRDCLEGGVPESQFFDCGISTSQNLERYYSYRMEQGQTGRLLAVLGYE